MTPRKKTAVIITHGMGEQVPMETLRGFVDAVWVTDENVHWANTPKDEHPDDIWIRPDAVTGSLELRRITTRWMGGATPQDKGPRVDFFEFYWADLAEGTTVVEIWDWLRTLLKRWPSQVPNGLLSAWLLLWAASILFLGFSFLAVAPWPGGWWHLVFVVAAGALGYAMQHIVSPYIGDVARYVRADPRNIAMRSAIRERGLKLLEDLHASKNYDRIIFVAHSLGTIVAYDLIALLWAKRERSLWIQEADPTFAKLRAVEFAAAELDRAVVSGGAANIERAREALRDAKRALSLSLRSGGSDGAGRERKPEEEWLISDFVTVGCALTHAQFLLSRDAKELRNLEITTLFPTDPPQFQPIESEQEGKIRDGRQDIPDLVWGPGKRLFSYYNDKVWTLHYAAPFAATRWTNIYDPHHFVFHGDIVSGPLVPFFGQGIRDINLEALRGTASQRFTHTRYWDLGAEPSNNPEPHLRVLRKAVNLRDLPEAANWA
jgi:hypothetical protein